VMPVVGVEKHTVGDGKVGPMARKLNELYSQLLEKECQVTNK